MKFKGLYTALITPFNDSQEIDDEALEALLNYQLDQKVDGLVILGTTAESPTLQEHEKSHIASKVLAKLKGKLPIIVGVGSNSTQHSIESAKHFENLGADALMVVTPYYNKPTSEGLYQHFKSVAHAVNLPIIIYNIQGRTAKNIDTPTLKRLSQISNIVAVKEASGNIEQMMEVIDQIGRENPKFSILSGDDALTLPLISLGGDGVISVISNLCPKKMKELVDFSLAGHWLQARECHYELLPLIKGAFIETNPIPIKEMMNQVGLKAGTYRLPLTAMNEDNKSKIKHLLQDKGLL